MPEYRCLQQQNFKFGEYSITPIRFEDRLNIMKWRNEQVYHLRQNGLLTKEKQDDYFENVLKPLFKQEQPNQILFSFLKGEECIGYGGLVHINWVDINAEVSFIMATELEKDAFHENWTAYLQMLEQMAFVELGLHKIYLYAFDLRPHLYEMLEDNAYTLDARLTEHCFFKKKYLDVIIYSKLNQSIYLREASESDVHLTFSWATNSKVRRFALNQDTISYKNHSAWFLEKIKSKSCYYLIAKNENTSVGSFRLDVEDTEVAVISYLLDPNFHGRGLGEKLLQSGVEFALNTKTIKLLIGYVLEGNEPSVKLFKKLGFKSSLLKQNLLEFKLPLDENR